MTAITYTSVVVLAAIVYTTFTFEDAITYTVAVAISFLLARLFSIVTAIAYTFFDDNYTSASLAIETTAASADVLFSALNMAIKKTSKNPLTIADLFAIIKV